MYLENATDSLLQAWLYDEHVSFPCNVVLLLLTDEGDARTKRLHNVTELSFSRSEMLLECYAGDKLLASQPVSALDLEYYPDTYPDDTSMTNVIEIRTF